MVFHEIIGSIFLFAGLVFQLFGIYGIFKHKHFYVRLSISSLIDSAGFIAILVGLMIFKGFDFATLKLGFILLLMILLNPLSNHILGRGAYLSSYHPERQGK